LIDVSKALLLAQTLDPSHSRHAQALPARREHGLASLNLDSEDLAAIEAAVKANAIMGKRYDERGLNMVNL
jgi:hypothetical protein